MSRNALAGAIAAAALILQVTVANRVPLPGSVSPDLLLLAIVALALVNGPMVGLVTGFVAGIAADVVPPADHAIGRYALVYCLVGYACGLLSDEMDRSPVLPFVAVAGGALAGAILYVVVGLLLSDPRVSWPIASRVVPLSVFYDVVVSPFVVWVVLRLTRRLENGRDNSRIDAVPGFYRAR